MSAATTGIDVRAKYWLAIAIGFDEGATIRIGDDAAYLFEGDPEDFEDDEDPRDACVIQLHRLVDRDVAEALDLVAARRLPKGSDLTHPVIVRALKRVQPDDVMPWHIPVLALPRKVQDEIGRLRRDLDETRESVGRALRWRLGSQGAQRTLVASGETEWSNAGGPWRTLPHRGESVRFSPMSYPVLTGPALADIEAMAIPGAAAEPVAHAILREATENLGLNPRSSLVLCVVALEVGVKHFISRAAPEASWLATEVASPPIAKMIASYLPTLAGKDERRLRRPPRELLKLIGDATEARNAVAHRGASGLSLSERRQLVDVTRAFLYAVDFVIGTDWAIEVLTQAERQTWLAIEPEYVSHRR